MLERLRSCPSPRDQPWIAHLGGSFNPVHEGHLAVARLLLQQYGFSRVVLVPNSGHYAKGGLAPEDDRLALLHAAARDTPGLVVRDSELGRDRATSTLETISELHEELGAELDRFQLFWVRGADAVQDMARWRSLPKLTDLCTVLMVPRDGVDLLQFFLHEPRLEEHAARFLLMDGQDVPPVSATGVRRSLLEGRMADLPVPPAVLEEMRCRGMYGLTAPGEQWITLCRPSYSGPTKRTRDGDRDTLYGCGRWRTAFSWGGRIIRYVDALYLYEDAYLEHFRAHPDDLDWIVNTACEVFDNSETNVLSGLDYAVQEAATTHLQDIAVRRCLVRLGLWFKGDHLVEIRARDSEGYRLNPGQIDFHRLEMIVQPEPRSWWRPGSVESFWQSNKVFQVKAAALAELPLVVHVLAMAPDGRILAREEGGRPTGLPCFSGSGADDLEEASAVLTALGTRPADLVPLLLEPVAREGQVHVLQAAEVGDGAAGDCTQFFTAQQMLSNCRQQPAKNLLKKAFKTWPG